MLGQGDDIGAKLSVWLAATQLAFDLARTSKPGNKSGLFVLRERTCYLPHHDAAWVARVRQIIARGGNHFHATRHEQHNPQFLGDKIAGEAARILDKYAANAVALDAIK